MPACSKCGNSTKGHPTPWGPQCTWDGQPVVPEEGGNGGKESGLAGGDKESSPKASGAAGANQEPSLKPDAPEGGVGSRSAEGRDNQIQLLQEKVDKAAKLIADQNKALEERKKDEMIASLQAKLAQMELIIQQNVDKLSSPVPSLHTPPAGPAVSAASAFPATSIPRAASVPNLTVDPSLAAYAGAVAASQQQQQAPAPAPVSNLTPAFVALEQQSAPQSAPPAPAQSSTPQSVFNANPLTKAILEAAQSVSVTADSSDKGKAKYLPHKFILKPGVREAKSVDNLSFAEFMHAYLRMLEAMYEDQEPMAERIDFIIRLVSEATHTRWADVRELYMLFEQEVLRGQFGWNEKFEGQIEKTAYKHKGGNEFHGQSGKAHHQGGGSHGKAGGTIIACKDWNWKDECRFGDGVCSYKHLCFVCLQKGSFKEHKGKECPSRAAMQPAPSTRGAPRM